MNIKFIKKGMPSLSRDQAFLFYNMVTYSPRIPHHSHQMR